MCKDNSNLYFACLTRFDSHGEFFDFKHYFSKFCDSFVPDFENLHSRDEIVLDITGFQDEEVLDKQSLTGYDH